MLNLLQLLLLLHLLTSRTPTTSAQEASSAVNTLAQVCNLQTLYAANSTYQSNLRVLGANLSRDAYAFGFAIGRAGVAPDEVFGLALCRGDYTGNDCATALADAFRDVAGDGATSSCSHHADTAIYYDQYMLRFTNDRSRLSSLTNAPVWSAKNMNNVTGGASAAARFMGRAVKLMNRTADLAAAASNSSGRRYATGEAWFGEHGVGVVYGLAQCTPDLTGAQCRSCLAGIIAQMPVLFSDPSGNGSSIGGRILGVRCNLHYETDLFYQETSSTLKLDMPKKLLLQRDLVILEKEIARESDSRFSLFRFSKIKDATNNFSAQNKLGEGGFGLVYQGRLSNNLEIAVKQLSPSSVQGFREFKNEIKLIASLQHRNLVRLLGCCIKGKERILIYEYMPNGSLEEIMFGEGPKQSWLMRRHIIEGIAEGLLYIHNYANNCIVHRDLKPSNILLDHEMNPKISDFGIARICLSNVTESNTTTVMGTFGYIAPEYYSQNVYSTRSDVFSFGILVLEIIGGKRAAGSYKLSGRSYELRRYAWQLWRNERCDEFVDPCLGEEYQGMDIIRCIHVALLCVQDSPEDRPTMHDVTIMLSNRNSRLVMPVQPGSIVQLDADTKGW